MTFIQFRKIETSVLFINGGGNTPGGGIGNPPTKMDLVTGYLCLATGSVTASTLFWININV